MKGRHVIVGVDVGSSSIQVAGDWLICRVYWVGIPGN